MTRGREPFRYRAFGLAIESDFVIAEAEPLSSGGCELYIRAAKVPPSQMAFEGFRNHEVTAEGDLLEYRDVGRFLVRGGGIIDVDIDPAFDLRLIGLPLLGPVMACHLHRRNLLVLHGSAVAIAGDAHVFLGDKGQGKSTTAAALVAAGFPLVADDVVALETRGDGRLAVRAAFPAMKLDAEMMNRFAAGVCQVIEPDEGLYTGGKSRVRLTGGISRAAVPLGKIHCLARGSSNAIETLPTPRALHALIRFSHHPRLGPAANTPVESAALFVLATRLAPLIRADILTVKHGLAEIGELGAFLSAERQCDAVAA